MYNWDPVFDQPNVSEGCWVQHTKTQTLRTSHLVLLTLKRSVSAVL